MNKITQKELKLLLTYSPMTGKFVWNVSRRGHAKKGAFAGTLSLKDGYIYLKVSQRRYVAHRLAFLYMTGTWPKDKMDHINHVRNDNRWENLRECSSSQNNSNRVPVGGSSRYKGVCIDKNNKWLARVTLNNKTAYVGHYDCEHEAALAYNKKASELHGEFAYLNEVVT